MIKIKIMNEFMHGPIWTYGEDGISRDDIPLIANDLMLQKLNRQCEELYTSFYEFDTHNTSCWFNQEKEKESAPQMLALIFEIIARLEFINDGSFTVEDCETNYLRSLLPDKKES